MGNKEQILDIPIDKFTVNVEPKFLFDLIENAIQKAGRTSKLNKILIEEYHLRRYNQKEFSNNLRKWQKKKHRIYLSYYLKIGEFISISKDILYSMILEVRMYRSKRGIKLTYPFNINESWVFISECIRVEGHLTKKKIILENTNTELTYRFKEELFKLSIPEDSIKEILNLKIQVPENINKNEIEVINLKTQQTKRFYERILNLRKGNKKEIIFLENDFRYGNKIEYKIKYKNESFKVIVFVPIYGKIIYESSLDDGRYQKACVSLRLEIYNRTLCFILNKIFEVPYGNKSKLIRIPTLIKNLPNEVLMKSIGAIFAAESTVSISDRFIAIGSLSKNFLLDLQQLLLKFNITSTINKNKTVLVISGIRNFRKIFQNFDLVIKEKNESLKTLITNTYLESSPRGLAKVLYLKSLSELKIANSTEIRNNANRVGNSFRQYIKELLDLGYIKSITSLRPVKYRATPSGKRFLKVNETYWK